MDIDALYDGFCSTLPPDLRAAAHELPYRLHLCPLKDAPWSRVFSHEVTLAAPALVAESLPNASPAAIRDATLSHLLAVVHAFTVDRLADGQTARTPELETLARALASGRNASLAALVGPRSSELFSAAEFAMYRAIEEEQTILHEGVPMSLERYLSVSLDKQRVGFVASVALARVAERSELIERIESLLAGVALGLQLEDDVVDWQEDFERFGAWALCLARGLRSAKPPTERSTEPNPIVALVHRSGVLARMMHESERQLASASQLAHSLSARRLKLWAQQRAIRARQLAGREEMAPGYTFRAHRLAPWAAEVLR